MKKLLSLTLAFVLMLSLAACGESEQPAPATDELTASEYAPENEPVPAAPDPAPSQSSTPVEPLTPEEQTILGVWEAADGSIIAIRERGGRERQNFGLDAIYLEPVSGEWIKITRDETTFFVEDGRYILSDLYDCPDPEIEGNLVQTEERLVYDPTNDTLLQISRHPVIGHGLMEWTNDYTRSDKSITDAAIEWEWYYEIEPNRK